MIGAPDITLNKNDRQFFRCPLCGRINAHGTGKNFYDTPEHRVAHCRPGCANCDSGYYIVSAGWADRGYPMPEGCELIHDAREMNDNKDGKLYTAQDVQYEYRELLRKGKGFLCSESDKALMGTFKSEDRIDMEARGCVNDKDLYTAADVEWMQLLLRDANTMEELLAIDKHRAYRAMHLVWTSRTKNPYGELEELGSPVTEGFLESIKSGRQESAGY